MVKMPEIPTNRKKGGKRHFKGINHLNGCLDFTDRAKNLIKVESKDISLGGQAKGVCFRTPFLQRSEFELMAHENLLLVCSLLPMVQFTQPGIKGVSYFP